ncbi:hypothetical protein FA95DRAFT_1599967, partial [Auriscalpium vulgare]
MSSLELGPSIASSTSSSFPSLPEGDYHVVEVASVSGAGSRRNSYFVHPQPPHMNPGPGDVSHYSHSHPLPTRDAYEQVISNAPTLSENPGRQKWIFQFDSTGTSIPTMHNSPPHPTPMYQPPHNFPPSSHSFTPAQTGTDSEVHGSLNTGGLASQFAGRSNLNYPGAAANSSFRERAFSTQWDKSSSATQVSFDGLQTYHTDGGGPSHAVGPYPIAEIMSAGAKLAPSTDILSKGTPRYATGAAEPPVATLKRLRDGADDDERPSKSARTAQTSTSSATGQAPVADEESLSDPEDVKQPKGATEYANWYRDRLRHYFKRMRASLGVPAHLSIVAAYADAARRAELARKDISTLTSVKSLFGLHQAASNADTLVAIQSELARVSANELSMKAEYEERLSAYKKRTEHLQLDLWLTRGRLNY